LTTTLNQLHLRHMNTEQKITKTLTPVYLSVPQLERLMTLAASRKLDNVSLKMFRDYGFNESDASLAVSCLKFLGLVDDANSATPAMDKLRLKGDLGKKEWETIVRTAYSKLFNSVEKPYELPQDELFNEFNVRYTDSIKSDRVARSAVIAFLKLCEYAGLREEGSIVVQRRAKGERQAPRNKIATAQKQGGDLARKGRAPQEFAGGDFYMHPVVKGKMTITIPEDLHLRAATDDDLSDAWRVVLKAAHKFAEAYLKDETPNTDVSGGS
jgi:hypothetical protein